MDRCKAKSEIAGPVTAMGLAFPNPIGLAAGFDRTGERATSLMASGFGHIEIGTINSSTDYAGPARHDRASTPLGINIGSSRPGIDDRVIEDYALRLSEAAFTGDYAVANLTAPRMNRNGHTPGVENLVSHLCQTRYDVSRILGRRIPLLIKVDGGPDGTPLPAAIAAAATFDYDGIIVVSDSLQRVREIARHVAPLTLVSVGGILTSSDVQARLNAGATLVQAHRVFAERGVDQLHHILEGF